MQKSVSEPSGMLEMGSCSISKTYQPDTQDLYRLLFGNALPLECYSWLVPRAQWVQTPHLAEKGLEGDEPSPHWNASSTMRLVTPPASPVHLDVKHAPLDVFLSPSPSQLPVRASPCYGGRAVTAPVLGSASVGLRLLSLRPCTVAKLWWTRNSNRASLRFLFCPHHVDAAHWFLGSCTHRNAGLPPICVRLVNSGPQGPAEASKA